MAGAYFSFFQSDGCYVSDRDRDQHFDVSWHLRTDIRNRHEADERTEYVYMRIDCFCGDKFSDLYFLFLYYDV